MSEQSSPIHDKEAAWAAFHLIRAAEVKIGGLSTKVRLAVFESSNWRCCYCGIRMLSRSNSAPDSVETYARQAGIIPTKAVLKNRRATIEHIIRRTEGGGNDFGNLAAACGWCNSSRGELDAIAWFEQVQVLKRYGEHPHFLKSKAK